MEGTITSYASALRAMLDAMPYDDVVRAAEVLVACHARASTVFIAGNGGSASTASHFACDLAKGTIHRALPRFRVIALTDNVPLMTAWGNDVDFEQIFAEQLTGLLRADDVLVLISASGTSPNVVAAARVAQEAGATVIALAGPPEVKRYGSKKTCAVPMSWRIIVSSRTPRSCGRSCTRASRLALRSWHTAGSASRPTTPTRRRTTTSPCWAPIRPRPSSTFSA